MVQQIPFIEVATQPFAGQKPGTSGLRKKVREFQQPGYLENFVQSVFDSLDTTEGQTLVIGGDGRYFNAQAIQIIISLAVANGFSELLIGQNGILSTPAASAVIRKQGACGGIVLSASHNPGGPDEDFGIKFNGPNGGPATERLTAEIYKKTQQITCFKRAEIDPVDLSVKGRVYRGHTQIRVIDSVEDYAELMAGIFDMDAIARLVQSDQFSFCFDAMHAVTGPYAQEILVNQLGAPKHSVINAQPLEDFGGAHPDPNLVHAADLVARVRTENLDFGAASDGDGDRNLVLGQDFYINPCDSLAVLAAQSAHIPAYAAGLKGVARSMPTSPAVDRVAAYLDIPSYETPTGWKFFGNLMDAQMISFCGEESFGTGSDHVREKDGLWAVLAWLNILAVTQCSPKVLVENHWRQFGRDYFTRHDFEAIDAARADAMMNQLLSNLQSAVGQRFADLVLTQADQFSYTDPVDSSLSQGQGIRLFFGEQGRVVVRLSGTGTQGATLRLYFDCYEPATGRLDLDPQQALAQLIRAGYELIELESFTGRAQPDVVT